SARALARSDGRDGARPRSPAAGRSVPVMTVSFDVGPRQWVQDVDRIADIQAISRPARHCRPRVKVEPLSVVRREQRVDGIAPARPRAAERAAVAGRQVAGSGALHQPAAPPDNRLRAPRGDAGDTATRDSTAWWRLRGPNGECDGPDRTLVRSRGSGSPGPGAAEHVVAPAEWCAFSHRPP